MQRRNWKEYNDKLVRRGEVYVSSDFLDRWDNELAKMRGGKVGRPFVYLGRDIVVAVDSSGMKVTNRGEWIRNKWKIRKGWIEAHYSY